MKQFLLILLITHLSCSLFGQHVLFLKSGEKMTGKVERYRNDTLTFNFKGNKMQFKSSEIATIYFDEKQVPSDQPKSTSQVTEQKQEGKISGVVTYFFNDNYGDKPDVGAEVFIVDTAKVPNLNYATLDSFYYGNFYKNLYNSYSSRGKKTKIPDDIIEEVKKYGVETKEDFDALDKRAALELFKLKNDNSTQLVVDGNGTFSASVSPGKYYVYVRSNNRTGHSVCEIVGKIYLKKVLVKAGETSNFSAKFGLY